MSADDSPSEDEARERVLASALQLVGEGGDEALEVDALLAAAEVDRARFDGLFGDVPTVRYDLVLRVIEQVDSVRREVERFILSSLGAATALSA